MSQLDLFSKIEPRSARCSLFLAIFPDARTAHSIYELGIRLCEKCELNGKLRPQDHLHISLHWLGDEFDELDRVVYMADQACKTVAGVTPAFEVTFDRVLTFKGRPLNQPLVLVGAEDGNVQLRRLQQLLAAKLFLEPTRRNANLKFTPHVTLLYDRQIPEEATRSVNWKVDEVVLVRSHVGATKYDRLASWALGV